MKTAFRFENGSSHLILTPETAREKQYLQLSCDGRPTLKLGASINDSVVVVFESHVEDVPNKE